MNEIEKSELKNRIKGMTQEELLVASKFIPTDMLWNELRRREEEQRQMIFNAKIALHEKEEN